MESIIALATEIKSSVKGQKNNAVTAAIREFSKMIKYMSGDPSLQDLRRINIFFKDELVPLYHCCTERAFQLAAKVLELSFSLPLPTVFPSNEATVLWNSVPGSIATGILNFLEADEKSNTKSLISLHFYEAICVHCFPDSLTSFSLLERIKGTTLTPIYQLLSDSVVGHAENRSNLQNPTRLGGERIGLALAVLQDFLPIEALLELFANLLPSVKAPNGRENRMRFIKQVFQPARFPNHQEIVALLNATAVLDWNVISLQISDMIASRNPSYPQPFKTAEVVMDESTKYTVERIYVDGSGFLASIDEGDTLGTLQLPYHHIEQFTISEPLNGRAVVTVTSKMPPITNQQFLPQESRNTYCSWEIQAPDVQKIVQALRHRKLDFPVKSYQRKMSLAKTAIALSSVHPSISVQIKEKDISALWSNINPTDTTSPLIAPQRSKSRSIAVPLQAAIATPRLEVSKPRVNNATSVTTTPRNKSYVVDASIAAPPAVPHNGKPIPGPTSPETEPEPSPSQVVRKTTRRHKEVFVIESDTEPESPARKKSQSGSPKQGAKAAASLTGNQTLGQQDSGPHVEPAPPTRPITQTLPTDSTLTPSPAAPARKHKRPRREADDGTEDKNANKQNERPTKRPRYKQDKEKPVLVPKVAEGPKGRKPPVKNRRTKAKTPSPVLHQDKSNIDLDAVPSAGRTVTTRMKGKDGKATSVKPKAVKPRPVRKISKRDNIPDVIQASPKTVPQLSKGKTEEANKVVAENKIKRPEHKKTQKIKKAPWDDPAFVEKIEAPKSEINTSSMRLLELQQDQSNAEIDMQPWESSSPLAVNLRTPTTERVQGDAEMIDLTKDDSPPGKGKGVLKIPTPPAKSTPRQPVNKTRNVHNLPILQAAQVQSSGDGEEATSLPLDFEKIANISVDVGIQVDLQESPPTTQVQVWKAIVPSPQSTRKIQPLAVERKRESVTALARPLKDRPKPIRVSSSSKARGTRSSSVANSPQKSRLTGMRVPDNLNDKIVNVLNEINEAILHKIDSRFEVVRSDLGMTQQYMLAGTRQKLEDMRLTSVGHYNGLVAVYEKYTTKRQENSELFDELKRANQEALEGVNSILLKHNRGSLSRKFPKSMFTNIPSFIKNAK